MKRIWLTVGLALALTACKKDENADKATGDKPKSDVKLEQELDKVAYGIGVNTGQFLQNNFPRFEELGIQLNKQMVEKGFLDALQGKELAINNEEIRTVLGNFNKQLQEKAQARQQQLATENKDKGSKYLAENKAKPDVTTTASGLQYKVLTEGKGEMPKGTDRVVVHYRGTLIDGTQFDSSYERNQPAEFGVTQVIKGWTEALQLMKAGSKWQLAIPAELAYGEAGRPGIPPNAVLLFDVELLEVKKDQPAAAAKEAKK